MNARQICIFFNFSKVIQQFVWLFNMFCKHCEPKIVSILICTLAEQFNVSKSYKMRESTMSWIGNSEENIDLSHIHLAVNRGIFNLGSSDLFLVKNYLQNILRDQFVVCIKHKMPIQYKMRNNACWKGCSRFYLYNYGKMCWNHFWSGKVTISF